MPAQMVMATNMFIFKYLGCTGCQQEGQEGEDGHGNGNDGFERGSRGVKTQRHEDADECGQEAAAGQSGNDGVEDSGDRLKEAGQQLALLVLQLILQIQVLIDGGFLVHTGLRNKVLVNIVYFSTDDDLGLCAVVHNAQHTGDRLQSGFIDLALVAGGHTQTSRAVSGLCKVLFAAKSLYQSRDGYLCCHIVASL